tara:strand:+ start:30157 stop:31299 length:1143 start_codon:yes stop_codon:yes gene_type:complete
MIKVLYFIIVLTFFCFGMPSHSNEVDLYSGEVSVKNDSQSVRNKALKSILRNVLVRLSGSMDIGGGPDIVALVEKAPKLVQEFRYRLDKSNSGTELTKKRYLWASFDKNSLNDLMRAGNIPIWDGNRPKVLIWLAGETSGKRQLFSADDLQELGHAINERAILRGMPIQFPLMDLQDQSSLSAADLWVNYEPAIQEASIRYPHQAILTGRLREGLDGWEANWILLDKQNNDNFVAKACCREDVILTGIDAAQDLLASRYAPTSEGNRSRRMRVSFKGVKSSKAYLRLMQLIQTQESITFVNVRGAELDTIYLDIWIQGGRDELIRISETEALLTIIPEGEKPIINFSDSKKIDSSRISQFSPINVKLIFNNGLLHNLEHK